MVVAPELVALDPGGLRRLANTLHGVADVYRVQGGVITEVLAGTGETAADALGDLRRVVAWCEHRRDEIDRRLRLLDALPAALPMPAWTFAGWAEARDAAERLAPRLRSVLGGDPPEWSALAPLLAEVERGAHDGVFAARLLTLVGPERTALLPVEIDRAARAAAGIRPSDGSVDRAQAIVSQALLVASRQTGPVRLSPAWVSAFAGLDGGASGGPVPGGDGPAVGGGFDPAVQVRLEALGFGVDLARALAVGLGAGTVATVLGGVDKVLAVVRLGSGEIDGWDVASTGVGLAGSLGTFLVAGGMIATPLGVAAVLGGSMVASAVAWFLGQVDGPPEERSSPEYRRRRHSRTYDPVTGTSHFPGGGVDRPHQDGAGGVLPPDMTR